MMTTAAASAVLPDGGPVVGDRRRALTTSLTPRLSALLSDAGYLSFLWVTRGGGLTFLYCLEQLLVLLLIRERVRERHQRRDRHHARRHVDVHWLILVVGDVGGADGQVAGLEGGLLEGGLGVPVLLLLVLLVRLVRL
jgi:hypothetical protein